MGSIETPRKRDGFRHIENSDSFMNTRLDKEIRLVVYKWTSGNKKFKEDYKRFLSPSALKRDIRTLKEADALLKRLAPWLRTDQRMPTIEVRSLRDGASCQMKLIDYLAEIGVTWVADWLSEINMKQGGRPPEAMVANCAEELAGLFKQETGQSKWNKVGKIVAGAFPEILPPDYGARDLRLWIYNLVRRNRRRRNEIDRQKMSFFQGSINPRK